MTKRMKHLGLIMVLSCLGFCLSAGGTLFAADPPKPGTVIDKNNCMQYKDYFPEFWLNIFTNGWDIIKPISIKLVEGKPNPIPEKFLAYSEKNKGKYGVDADGHITGGPYEKIVGFPFPGVKPGDQDFATKLMWNYDYRYSGDDCEDIFTNLQRRRGESITISDVDAFILFYQSRMFTDPVPDLWTDSGWRNANMIRILTPPSQRNLINNLIRYKEQREPDLTYIYLPTMRRVLRGEAGQRATPIASSTQAPDDFSGGFAGRIPAFTYKYIGEKTIVALDQATVTYSKFTKEMNYDYIYIEEENWELRDVYVIDVFSKDASYPQGRKRLWIDKQTYFALYACAWDRAGSLWKIWQTAACPMEMNNGGTFPYMRGMLGVDIQLGYGVQMIADWSFNGNDLRESDISVSAMRRMAR